jgi:hypothetical protein
MRKLGLKQISGARSAAADLGEGLGLCDDHARKVGELKVLEQRIGVRIDLNAASINIRKLRNEVVLALALLLLELERNAAHGSLGDTAHQVCGETSNLVAQTLRRDNSDLLNGALVGLEIGGQTRVVLLDDDARSLLDSLGTNATLPPGEYSTEKEALTMLDALVLVAFCFDAPCRLRQTKRNSAPHAQRRKQKMSKSEAITRF